MLSRLQLIKNNSQIKSNILRFYTSLNGNGNDNNNNNNSINDILYTKDVEELINKQISIELTASHNYLVISSYLSNVKIGLYGGAGFFLHMSNDERDHAFKFINYQNRRGGTVFINNFCDNNVLLNTVYKKYNGLIDALTDALNMEKVVEQALYNLNKIAENNCDIITMDYVTSNFLHEQVKMIIFYV